LKKLNEQGRLDYIPLPKSPLQEALKRESNNKYSFEGIINEVGMKSYGLEQLQEAADA